MVDLSTCQYFEYGKCSGGRVIRGLCEKHHGAWRRGVPGVEALPPQVHMDKGCKYPSCTNPHRSLGWCNTHYHRSRNGTPMEGRPTKAERGCLAEDCERPHDVHGYCYMHWNRVLSHGSTKSPRPDPNDISTWPLREGPYGYMYRNLSANAHRKSRRIGEHRYVMQQHLGRPLERHETVHHKNGDRKDNRIENLELWSHSQPAGQRVADKAAWAREILGLYGTDEEKKFFAKHG